MKEILAFLILSTLFLQSLSGQQEIKGVVSDESKSPLPGVTVQVKNTFRGAITDINGNYTIEAQPSDTLLFSMMGMMTKKEPVGTRTKIDIVMLIQTTVIEEVVVIGYGVQRAKDLTAPIISIKGEALSKQITSNPMQALQGKVAGVQIINSGIPGGGSSVRIRGVGSIGDYANPLYVVDGVFVDNIDFLSSGDIEDLTVLKDASASAIYGVRAANGVILVTTKKGKTVKPVISYDGYFGMQVPVNIMPMATKDQYVTLMNEANANVPGYVPRVSSAYPASTDWYQELVRPAPTNNHSLDISGTNDKTSYSVGGSYFYQQGIMDSKNDYKRYNFRGRIDQKVNNILKIGINTVLSNYSRNIPNDGAFFGAYVNPPVYNIYDETNTAAYPVKFASPQTYGFGNQYGNPVAAAYYVDNIEKGTKLVFSSYAEFDILKDKLTYKLSYNSDLNFWNNRDYSPEYNVGGSQGVRKSSLTKSSSGSSKQIIDNLLTYHDKIDNNSFTVLLGQSTRMEKWQSLSGYAQDVPGFDEQSKYLSTGSYKDRNAYDGASVYNGLSFFTRGTYNKSDKYLATFTFRADASSKYQDKWGFFPAAGLGWVLSEENFMKDQKVFDYLKLRASWGMLGNDNVPANSAMILGQTGAGSSGIFNDQLVDGVGAQTVVQNYLKWEVVNEFDIGIDYAFLNNKLTGEIDYYHRVTNNVVFYAPIATGGGVAELLGNNGSVLNQGIELNLNWKKELKNGLSYNIGLNVTSIANKVLKLEGRDYIPSAMIRGNYTTRTQVGHPIGSFYGYEISGVYASEAEALRDPVSQGIKDRGFFKYKDQNNDNIIDDKDKVFLGSAIPWMIAGIDFGLNYKQFDLSAGLQGQVGNKILNAKRMNRDVFTDGNYDQNFYKNRWTSDNKSDKYPSAEAYNYSYTQQANDFFVESGSYIRIQNIQVGYTTEKIKFIPMLRVYVSAQRPYTFFTYKGFTPEVGGSPISSGIDNSVYPMQAIYTLGLKMNF
jgi:TonB-linked SusC/RagA family outer membrane protein